MEIKYSIYKIKEIIVCVPSEDYYARGNDWQTQTIQNIEFYGEFSTMEDAITYLKANGYKGEYNIMQTQIVNIQ